MQYLFDHFDEDFVKVLMIQLRDLWTYNSTAIEGNSLTLGDTAFVLREGLAVGGKPLKDHLEVVGHARAIDMMDDLIQNDTRLTEKELFALHRAVESAQVLDGFRQTGCWKKERNFTVGAAEKNKVVVDFAMPEDVPRLMASWFELFYEIDGSLVPGDKKQALNSYVKLHFSFVRIHPFSDGNGRLARLSANLPVLKSGMPPVIIPQDQRRQYMNILAACHLQTGPIKGGDDLLPEPDALEPLILFCEQAWQHSFDIVENVRHMQQKRDKEKGRSKRFG
jgi:Fic family protein